MRTQKTLHTSQGEISYEEEGSGPPLLMIHGLFAAGSTFDELTPLLSKKARCIRPDLPGSGNSKPSSDFRPSWESYAEFVESFAKALGLETFDLLGHSMGGGISTLAAARSKKVDRLILLDPVVLPFKTPLKGRLPLIPMFGELLFRLYGEGMFLDYFRKDVFYRSQAMNEQKVRELYRSFSADKIRALAALRATNDPGPPSRAVREIGCPTLIIWGERDALVPPALSEVLEGIIERSRVKLIPDCGHSPPEEKPEATAKHIMDFLA